MAHFKCLVFLCTLICSLPVSAQHNHGDAGNSSDLTFVEMMLSLQVQLEILTRSVIIDDFETAHDAAYAIATHQGPSTEELAMVMKALQGKFKSFEACDAKVHDLAMKTAINAHKRDGNDMVDTYTNLVKQIRLCHLEFRDMVKHAN